MPVDPGPAEGAHLEALLERLLREAPLREAIGRLAREHVAREHRLEGSVARLLRFLAEVEARKDELLRSVLAQRFPEEGLAGYLLQEVRRGALDLGLPGLPPGVQDVLADLAGGRR